MKKLILFTIILLTSGSLIFAKGHNDHNEDRTTFKNNRSQGFKILEQGAVFKLFSDGSIRLKKSAFDRRYAHATNRRASYSYNTMYGTDTNYMRYDQYGRLKRVGSTRITYDRFDRVKKIGNIDVAYNRRGLVRQIGGMQVYYSRYNTINFTEGTIHRRVCKHMRTDGYNRDHINAKKHKKKKKSKHYENCHKKSKTQEYDDD
ncbi:hypothetical protein [Aquimarina intermedia]|uniref:YD repeat-containing protein n=1 Tax=Aquimarina intermedia TaxID=350814 RepID=A0A5S5C6M2_9FLAO|nr:hypothetical protein [Aquimarina intermedia]TYP74947.1 hypothetical protein BD809_1039 [Aquimarina intermedia]